MQMDSGMKQDSFSTSWKKAFLVVGVVLAVLLSLVSTGASVGVFSWTSLVPTGVPTEMVAWADENSEQQEQRESAQGGEYVTSDDVEVSHEGKAARIANAPFAVENFSRAQKGSNREVNGSYIGYAYYEGDTPDKAVAISTPNYVVVHVPLAFSDLCDPANTQDQELLKSYFCALDQASINGGVVFSEAVPWYFTSDTAFEVNDLLYSFGVEPKPGDYYVTVSGPNGEDVVSEGGSTQGQASPENKPTHVDFCTLVSAGEVAFTEAPSGLTAFVNFLQSVDYSPLWVTLKTTGTAIVFIFVLGLLAAYFSLRIPKRAQDIADAIFTIPMVLPPTVCGFLLLLLLGKNTALGQWFIDIGFPLIFSWPATVIAAVVVAFPLMYRNARGAFEGLDPNMLDAARTLGWSNAKIFFKLMLPLSWSSIAAGTVLSFARALGEFGATLFLAGNYVGITRTIPIAIYFEWMSGNIDVALFWTVIIIIFSFIVILFINLWGRRTTKYRRRVE